MELVKRNTLHMMVGLPRSGKSTKSKELGYPIVEPDAIRQVIHGTPFKPNVEHLVWSTAKLMVECLFMAGHVNVILDATNHTVDRRKIWENNDWVISYHVIETPEDICVQRSKETNQEYLIPIIQRMHRDFEPVGGKLDG